jgi:hypothetical protein
MTTAAAYWTGEEEDTELLYRQEDDDRDAVMTPLTARFTQNVLQIIEDEAARAGMSKANAIRALVHRGIAAEQNREAIALDVLRDIRFNTSDDNVEEAVELLEGKLQPHLEC